MNVHSDILSVPRVRLSPRACRRARRPWLSNRAREHGFLVPRLDAREHLKDMMGEFDREKDQGCAAGCLN